MLPPRPLSIRRDLLLLCAPRPPSLYGQACCARVPLVCCHHSTLPPAGLLRPRLLSMRPDLLLLCAPSSAVTIRPSLLRPCAHRPLSLYDITDLCPLHLFVAVAYCALVRCRCDPTCYAHVALVHCLTCCAHVAPSTVPLDLTDLRPPLGPRSLSPRPTTCCWLFANPEPLRYSPISDMS